MDYRQLGRSGLRVSTMTMGTMTFGGSGGFAKLGDTDVDGARRQLDAFLDAGGNLVDTANMYSDGLSEEITGKALKGRWDRALIATKVRFRMGEGPNDAGLSRQHIIAQCEASLRRLDTDHIDLYQVHQWDGQTPLEETLSALDRLVQDGKVRYIGCSNYSAWHIMKALSISDSHHWERYVSQQIHYTLQAREAENELVGVSIDQGLGILVWSPMAGGLLSGKYRRGKPAPEGSRHLGDWQEPPVDDTERLYDIVEELVRIGEEHNVSAAQVSLAWLLAKPYVTSVIFGARTQQQLEDNLGAAELSLSEADIAALDEVSRRPLQYPYWHQAAAARDRLSAADLPLLGPYLG